MTKSKKPKADHAHLSEVRRAAALASAKVRSEKAKTKRKPKTVGVSLDAYDRLEAYARATNKTVKQAATEAIEHGLAHLQQS